MEVALLARVSDHTLEDLKTSAQSTSSGARSGAASHERDYDSRDDVGPDTSLYPRSSLDSYASTTASREDLAYLDMDGRPDYDDGAIPPLPEYRCDIVEPNVRVSTPLHFASLYPSLNRLTIRHDEYTTDGNMNLRIDTVLTDRKRTAVQLFHLRMYDLARREFSLRRYSRDSGREVCNSKRKFIEPAPARPRTAEERPTLKRSMSAALSRLGGGKPALRRATSSIAVPGRPGTGYSTCAGSDELHLGGSNLSRLSLESRLMPGKARRPVPTNTIKLEFSNYARVDVTRRGGNGSKRYDFEWWGHRYSWKRAVHKQLGLVSFHLVRDGKTGAPVAHIVPETRSPSQILADENAGGWVPPCFMWIADKTVVDAVTDVADVIMATGLIALVDDCIRERWQTKKAHRIPMPLTTKTVNLDAVTPKAIMQHVFGRRNPNNYQRPPTPASPLRYAEAATAY
ncbi:b22844ce-d182-46ff-bc86-a28c81ac6212 [Thermothielavioides terrestris]|uniref:B22844ce-d182-46ff-bc86-a28c81ac6212 n=1 Tax=Thermothielavioides terrestris TaxID=2587410 RepID=A0A3S4AT33_9PEZI|nr:b22844ce-d182-46ff-bc86-a28c81ac6212 [Thermothielavioides terrestris]